MSAKVLRFPALAPPRPRRLMASMMSLSAEVDGIDGPWGLLSLCDPDWMPGSVGCPDEPWEINIWFPPNREGWRHAWRRARRLGADIEFLDTSPMWWERLSGRRLKRWYRRTAPLFGRIRTRREART